MKIFKCLLCGRDKFTSKQPHNCVGGFRKRRIKWEIINQLKQETMTKVTILREEQGSGPKKKIEFLKFIDVNGNAHIAFREADSFSDVILLSRSYRYGKYDLMFAWDDDPKEGYLYLGYFNDGVV